MTTMVEGWDAEGDVQLELADRLALVVSPDRSARTAIGRACQQGGFQPIDCLSVGEAVNMATEVGVAVCCLDCPDPESLELPGHLQALRAALPETVPILLVTPAQAVTQHEALYAQGVTEVFSPAQPDRLAQYLRTRDAERNGPRGQHVYGKRVLLVEDSRTVAHVVRKILVDHGLMVDWVSCGEDALEHVARNRYDLLITDLVLEGAISGMALVGQLRQDGHGDFALPILAMTGFDDPSRRRELFRLGVNDYVIKPVMEEELLVRARNLIIAHRLAARVEAQRARLNLLEVTDQLTGLYNRRMLFNMGSKYVAMARRAETPFSVVLLDVEELGEINVQYGHEAGDEVLRLAASALRDAARESDLLAREGDTRFALALPHCAPEDALRVGARCKEAIEALLPFGMQLTASLGVASFDPARFDSFDGLVAQAARALEQARDRLSFA
ncbi:MAG: diguanylate cyclase [Pseudomonadota bacterium]